MPTRIKKLILNDQKYSSYEFNTSDGSKEISELSHINIFVGANSSGKSRFMRNIISESEYLFIPDFPLEIYNDAIQEMKDKIGKFKFNNSINEYNKGLLEEILSLKTHEALTTRTSLIDPVTKVTEKILNTTENAQFTFLTSLGYHNQRQLRVELKSIVSKFRDALLESMKNYINEDDSFTYKKVYIPTLRGLRPIDSSEGTDLYLDRTLRDYFPEQKNGFQIFTGLSMYEETKRLLLGNLDQRERISEFQNFLSESFFEGKSIALIPSLDSDVLFVKIGEEKEQPIYKLGDGIQSIIILTFPLFINKAERLMVCFEEPELYFHPGLQRKFLETLTTFDQHMYFLTTHSNHFLDITLDLQKLSIFSFNKQLPSGSEKEKEAIFIVENVSNEDNSLLEMLGVKNSSVFLSNCTIWVEGITDRFYLRHYLKLYQESLGITSADMVREDYHYSFVEYSGGNITHWSFLDDNEERNETYKSMNVDRLCSKLFLVTDKDDEKKLPRQEKLKIKLGTRYYCLECKEIENLIGKNVLKKVIAEYEKVDEQDLHFNTKFSEKTYKDKYLGKFIDGVLKDKQRKGNYGTGSGTITDKVKFCQKAISHMKCFTDLTEEAQDLARKIYTFIKGNNI